MVTLLFRQPLSARDFQETLEMAATLAIFGNPLRLVFLSASLAMDINESAQQLITDLPGYGDVQLWHEDTAEDQHRTALLANSRPLPGPAIGTILAQSHQVIGA